MYCIQRLVAWRQTRGSYHQKKFPVICKEYSVICKEYSEKGYKHLRMHTRIVRLTLFVLQFLLRKYSENILPKCINTIRVLLRS
jgi:hypothetical protein